MLVSWRVPSTSVPLIAGAECNPRSPLRSAVQYLQRSAYEGILHLFCRTEAELARRRDLNDLARVRVATLTRLAVFHLELAEASQVHLFALLCGLDDAGEHGINRLLGRALLDASFARHVVNQIRRFHAARLQTCGGERARD